MAALTITLPSNTHICHGKVVTFRAPCDCTNITSLIVKDVTYELVDASTRCISKTGEMFSKGSMVSVIFDTDSHKAWIQNTVLAVVDNLESDSSTSALSANQGRALKELIKSKIIYSDDEPSVVEGAIWLKPRR